MSLTSVAAPIWNEIARTQTLKTKWAKMAFALDAEAMAALEDKEFKALKEKVGADVALAYLDVKPLLLENVAISLFTQAQPTYRPALPETVSIAEAVMLASKERPLSRQQQASLTNLLKADYLRR